MADPRICHGSLLLKWSGRLDLNQRPLDPQSSALPGCATPRPKRIVRGPRGKDKATRPAPSALGRRETIAQRAQLVARAPERRFERLAAHAEVELTRAPALRVEALL